ncbi:MAG: hypothetical protein M1829_000473 [Trizodia sp. TS-e1964]|nr:MAG: hypothetical protein M1829_000473 [Trizodia sp. TS-e1964]
MLEQLQTLSKREDYAPGSFWFYAPNKGAPIAFAILFCISGVIHAYQCSRFHFWRVTGVLPWSALLFVVGFILREVGAYNYDKINIFISSTVFLLAAPPVYEGANYFILGRILYYIPYHAPLHPGRVVTTFLAFGAVIESLTGNGAAKVANKEATVDQQNVGKALLKASLILQLATMAGFVAIAVKFQINCQRNNLLNDKLKRLLTVLYISSALITSRTIYRTVEYFQVAALANATSVDDISPIIKNEWFFWFFEVVLMYSNTTLLNVLHPARYLPKNNKIYLSRDGVTEVEGPGSGYDRRPFLVTLFDPFDIAGLIMGRDKKTAFWEAEEQRVHAAEQAAHAQQHPVVDGKAKETSAEPSKTV